MYIEQIYQVLLNRCNLEDDSQCYRDVHFIYEEGGNLGVAISDLARKWTSGLSRRLFSHLVLQDVQQLSSLYDEDTKDIILGNTGNLAYIRTGSEKTNNYISGRLGERSNYSKTRHKDPLSNQQKRKVPRELIYYLLLNLNDCVKENPLFYVLINTEIWKETLFINTHFLIRTKMIQI